MVRTKRQNRLSPAALCFGAALCIWLLYSCIRLGWGIVQKCMGNLPCMTLTAADMEWKDLTELDDGRLASTSCDPQFLWTNTEGIAVDRVKLSAVYTSATGEITLYYKTDEAQDWSAERRIYAQKKKDGTYVFDLPACKITSLRVDVCSSYNTIADFTCTLNSPRPWYTWFIPGWRIAYYYLLIPGLAACALRLLLPEKE